MYEYKKQNTKHEIPYRQMQKVYDLYYEKLIKSEDNRKFIAKYSRLNEQLKEEEQY